MMTTTDSTATMNEKEEEEEVLVLPNQNHHNNRSSNGSMINGYEFDEIVGFLENILVDETFVRTQLEFFQTHQETFDDDDKEEGENKLEYMDIFKKYCDIMERHIEDRFVAHFVVRM